MIEFSHVYKSFRHGASAKLLRHVIADMFREKKGDFLALQDVSFRLREGETMAIVGRNGAGKSTLLSLVAGLAKPTQGTVRVRGRVAALLELGSGFHPDLTGVENLRLNASLLGLNAKETEERFAKIVEFAELADFIEDPIRKYSTGMVMRLAFAVAVHVDADVLIIDEVLGVGDQAFQQKCHEKIFEMKRQGKTLLFVSHSAGLVSEMCERALWLEQGKVMGDGPAADVVAEYEARGVRA